MKVGFIGTGRMGGAMVRRLLEAKHDVGVYNRTPEKAKPLADAGAKIVGSVADAARYGDVIYTMLADDTALEDVVFRQGLLDALPKGGIHVCAGTHGIPVIRKIKEAHADKGQSLVAAPMMGRPELVTAGTAGVFASGPADGDGQVQAAVRGARPQDLRGRRRSGGRDRHEDRQQFRARLRHGGDGRRLRADAQIRRRHLRVLRRDDRRAVQLLGLQGLRQDHGGRELLARSARWRCSA